MRVLCANLEHQSKRKDLMSGLLYKHRFKYDFLKSTYWRDYKTVRDIIKDSSGATKEILSAGLPQLNKTNIAALISTWARGMEQIIKNKEITLFCVDDFAPELPASEFDQLASSIWHWDVISFWVHTPVSGKRILSSVIEEYPELRRGVGGAGDNALLVSPDGARKLLSWMYEYPCCITENMLHRKALAHDLMGYVDKRHFWIDHHSNEKKWFSFTEHYTESDTGLTGA